MNRVGIAFSGGANPLEIVDCVKLAEALGYDFWFTPRRLTVPIYPSAVFLKMMTLCGEIADGIVLTRSPFHPQARAGGRR
jgi:alkanesulfonate monooxygenase SsuD/methylene tetrahydromethanopterin reductase-like flavin-dependent oxidoreductase (luciferase family)